MKNIIFALVALLLVSGLASAQPNIETSSKYYVYISAKNTTDTIPGHQVGAAGAGTAGWLYVGGDDVYLTYWALDSVQSNIYVDYADSGVTSRTGSSAAVIPFGTVSVAAGDTLATMDATGDIGIVKRTLRAQATNSIGGAQFIRLRMFNLNNDNFAAASGDRVVRVRVLRIKR